MQKQINDLIQIYFDFFISKLRESMIRDLILIRASSDSQNALLLAAWLEKFVCSLRSILTFPNYANFE